MNGIDLRAEHGALPLVLLVIIAASGLMAAMVSSVVGSQQQIRFDRDFTQALPAADAGLAVALFTLNEDLPLVSEAGTTYERIDFPVGETTVEHLHEEDGQLYTWTLTRVETMLWEATSVAVVSGVERVVVATIDELRQTFLAAFTDRQLSFTGGNAADSYTSAPGVPNAERWCTGNGLVGSNDALRFSGGALTGSNCPRPTRRSVDGVNLYDWFDRPGNNITADDPAGDRCDHSGSGNNCRFMNDDYLEPRLIDDKLDLATDEQIAFIADALDACKEETGTLTTFRSSVDGTTLAPAPEAAEAVRTGDMGLAGGHYCYDNMVFDQDTALHPDASQENPVIIFVDNEVIAEGGGKNAVDVGCVGCRPGPHANQSSPPAAALRIFVRTGNVAFGNQAQFAGIMWAPRALCRGAGGGAQADIYGTLICREISNAGGWSFHFDDALVDLGSGKFTIARWREELPSS